MKYSVQLISNNILKQVPSIAVSFQSGSTNKYYLFNVPEQHSRYARRHHYFYGRGMSIFFTRFNSESMGGLVRMLLQLNNTIGRYLDGSQSTKQQKCMSTRLYLSNSAYIFWAAMRKSFGFRLLPYAFYNYDFGTELFGLSSEQQSKKLYQANSSKWIRAQFTHQEFEQILQNPCRASQFIHTHNQTDQSAKQGKQWWVYKDSFMEVRTFKISSPSSAPSQAYYNHICIPMKIHKKTDKQKIDNLCDQHPQINGPVLERLFTSGSLTLTSGITIDLAQFQQPYKPPANLLILHYKTPQNLQQIINNQHLKQSIDQFAKNQQYIKYIIHIVEGNAQILFSQEFSKLRLKFGNVEHIVCNKNCRDFGSEQEFRKYLFETYPHFMLCNLLQRYGFWVNIVDRVTQLYLKSASMQVIKKITKGQSSKNSQLEGKIRWEQPKYQLILAPVRLEGFRPVDIPDSYIKRKPFIPQVKTSQILNQHEQKLKQKLQQITTETNPTVIFLGTSSMRPNNQRNVSGILIKFQSKQQPEQFSILMDCGDGILDQFNNHFGIKYDQQLLKLRIVFVSHLHQDHCAGLFHFIAARNNLIKEQIQQKYWSDYKMFLIIPENMISWFQTFSKNTQRLDQFTELIIVQSILHPDVINLVKKFQKEQISVFTGQNFNPMKRPQIYMDHKTIGRYGEEDEAESKSQVLPKTLEKLQPNPTNESTAQLKKEKLGEKSENGDKKIGVFSKVKLNSMKKSAQNQIKTAPVFKKVKKNEEVIRQEEKKDNKINLQPNMYDECFESEDLVQQMQPEKPDSQIAKILEQFNKNHKNNLENFQKFLREKKITLFTPVPVYHCKQSYGLVMQHKSGVKISFSGDCRPTSVFLRMAQNSTLLIHEATFRSDKSELARFSRHSTTAQAIQVGYKSRSTMTLLTHFASLYSSAEKQQPSIIFQTIPNVDINHIKHNVGRATDHLQFKLSQMYKLPPLSNLL